MRKKIFIIFIISIVLGLVYFVFRPVSFMDIEGMDTYIEEYNNLTIYYSGPSVFSASKEVKTSDSKVIYNVLSCFKDLKLRPSFTNVHPAEDATLYILTLSQKASPPVIISIHGKKHIIISTNQSSKRYYIVNGTVDTEYLNKFIGFEQKGVK